jgi:hypothetical protein
MNQSAFSIAISYIISVYCEDYARYFTVILPFLAFFSVLHILYIWYLASSEEKDPWYFGVSKPKITKKKEEAGKRHINISAFHGSTFRRPSGQEVERLG